MRKMRIAVAIAAVVGLFALPAAWADLSVKDGGGTLRTVFGFTCFTTKLCNAYTPITSAGVEIAPATAAQVGEVQASPTANTVLDRLKVLGTKLDSVIAGVPMLPYPAGAVPYTATATGTTAATTATLAGAASVTTYICGFSIRANATAAATGNATVTGVIPATMNFTQWTAPLASGLGITEMIFSPCIPASATNTSVAVVSAAPGSGGVVSVSAWGFKL